MVGRLNWGSWLGYPLHLSLLPPATAALAIIAGALAFIFTVGSVSSSLPVPTRPQPPPGPKP